MGTYRTSRGQVRAEPPEGDPFACAIAGRAAAQQGFGLVEVLVSALMVAVIAAAVATALIAGIQTVSDQRARSRAAALAQLDQERLRGLSAVQLTDLAPPNQQVRTVTVGGVTYTITSTANFLNSTGGSACGSTGAGAAAYYEVISSVTWPTNHRSPVVMESQITPPAGGTLLVNTVDQTGTALPGVTVTANGPSSATGVTDTQGCAIFGGLSTGDYTLGITDAGYVNDNDVPADPLNVSATVTSTGTATPSGGNPIRLGLAGTFNANFWGATAGGQTSSSTPIYTAQPADSVSWYGTGSSDSMSSYLCQFFTTANTCPPPTTSYGAPTTQATGVTLPASGTQTLYPFAYLGPPVTYTGNYHLWAGPCRQEEPPAGTDSFTVGPGSVQTAAIQEPTLNVAVDFNGTQVKPNDLMLKFVSSSGTQCSDKWSTPVAASAATSGADALADPGQPFASTATSGSSESASTQTGTITACADYVSGRTEYYGTLPGLTNTSFSGLPALTSGTTLKLTTTSSQGTCAASGF